MHWFRRVIRSPQAPTLAMYQRRPLPSAGAPEFVYLKPVTWPLFTLWGNGILTVEQLNILQPNQLRAALALTKAPIYGAGVPAGAIELEPLQESMNAQMSNG